MLNGRRNLSNTGHIPRLGPTTAPRTALAPFFLWREEWCLGITIMDEDHRALVALIDDIARDFAENPHQGVNRRRRHANLLTRLRVLGEHAQAHFAREDELMLATGYPDRAEHQCEHALLLAEYADLLREIAATGRRGVLDIQTLEALKQWLLGHILDTDRHLAAFLLQTPH